LIRAMGRTLILLGGFSGHGPMGLKAWPRRVGWRFVPSRNQGGEFHDYLLNQGSAVRKARAGLRKGPFPAAKQSLFKQIFLGIPPSAASKSFYPEMFLESEVAAFGSLPAKKPNLKTPTARGRNWGPREIGRRGTKGRAWRAGGPSLPNVSKTIAPVWSTARKGPGRARGAKAPPFDLSKTSRRSTPRWVGICPRNSH